MGYTKSSDSLQKDGTPPAKLQNTPGFFLIYTNLPTTYSTFCNIRKYWFSFRFATTMLDGGHNELILSLQPWIL